MFEILWTRNASTSLCLFNSILQRNFNLSKAFKTTDASIKINRSERDPLVDRFGRRHTYLRISLTEKCNLRCTYCMPEEGVPLTPSENILTRAEITRLAKIFAINGVEKIRLTGGEPTIRRDLVEIVEELSHIDGIKEIGITSNGIVLARKLDNLIKAGLTHVNLSLDTLDGHKYMIITRRNGFEKVIKLIDIAEQQLKSRLKINCVVIRGINDTEITDFVALTEKKNIDIRFIEYMPFGGNRFETQKMMPFHEMLKEISNKFHNVIRLEDLANSTSKSYQIPGYKGRFGFITSMSEHFCATCNRVRITADGNLKVCLHGAAEVSLRDKLRAGANDAELLSCISDALQRKKAQHAGMENLMKMTNRPMILIENIRRGLSTIYKSHLNKLKKGTTTGFLLNNLNCQLYSVRQCSTAIHHRQQLTHLDARGRAAMVDVSDKSTTTRIAMATAAVTFPNEIFASLFGSIDDQKPIAISQKGDIIGVARIAGIAAAKRTAELIPLCHNIALSHVEILFKFYADGNQLQIYSRVKCKGDTGVEMEALTACTVAALTVYDMCKALSHNIEINEIRLLGKTGGKRAIGSVEWHNFKMENNEWY